MKALVVKDLYCLRSYVSQYVLLVAFIVFFSAFMDMGGVLAGIIVMYGANFTLSLFAMDEKQKWDAYCITMPFTRKQVVSARYAVSAVLVASLSLAALVVGVISDIIKGQPENIIMSVSITLAVTFIGYLSLAIIMPITYRYGSEKARFAMILSYAVVLGLFFGAIYLYFNFFSEASVGFFIGLLAALIALALALMLVSYRLSCKFILAREY